MDCCKPKEKKDKGWLSGIIYGLVPHAGCIAFIAFTILGMTTATAFLKPLMLNRYFFHFLIILSIVFATLAAIVYLKKADMLSIKGIKKKKKYLSILYGTTIGINLVLFMIIFPITANLTSATGNIVLESDSMITLKVDIPCPGHAPLISGELEKVKGVKGIKFRFPNYFDVAYENSQTINDIKNLEVFDSYPIKNLELTQGTAEKYEESQPRGCSRCGGCSGACGGTCSG